MDSPIRIGISKLILNRKLFLAWILVVSLPFAMVISIYSTPNWFLMEGFAEIYGVSGQTSTLRSVSPENLAPQPMLVFPTQPRKADANAMHSLLLNDGVNTSSSFEDRGQMKQIKPNDGVNTSSSFENRSQIKQIKPNDGVNTSSSFEDRGQIKQIKPNDGVNTSSSFEDRGQIKQIKPNGGVNTSSSFEDRGQIKQIKPNGGVNTSSSFEDRGQIKQIKPNGGVNTSSSFEDRGQIKQIKPNGGVNTSSSFEDRGQIKQIKPNGGEGKASKGTQSGKCNLFRGQWVHDSEGPYYTNESCPHIRSQQNCMKNGRPDKEYLYWRWKPDGCNIPRFNATLFLELVRGKVWAFVGDSVARNHMQSLLCMLSQVEQPNNTYRDNANIFSNWYFPSYNFKLKVVWSPYLVKSTKEEFKGVPSGIVKLHLDVLDPIWVDSLSYTDTLVLSTGPWLLQPGVYIMKDQVIGCHTCEGVNATEMGYTFAFRHAVRAALEGIHSQPGFQGTAFLQTFTVDHFEHGHWAEGGTCNRTTPYKKGEVEFRGVKEEMYKIVIEEFENGTKEEAPNSSMTRLMDITYCSLLRPDGHPGKYRDMRSLSQHKANEPVPNDCLHWCLPGPIDAWNEILLMMLKEP